MIIKPAELQVMSLRALPFHVVSCTVLLDLYKCSILKGKRMDDGRVHVYTMLPITLSDLRLPRH